MAMLWEPDRKLTIDMAAEVVRSSLPSIAWRGLRFLGAGWEFDAYLTSDGWVVRFPRRQEMAELFTRERPVHRLVAKHLPSGIAVPVVEFLGEPAAGFPYKVAAHRYIKGVDVDLVEDRLLPVLAPQIGAALSAIHSAPLDPVRELNLPVATDDDLGGREWLRRGLESFSQIPNRDPILEQAVRWVGQAEIPTGAFDGELRLIHQDLSPEHLLADPQTGRLTGIIDWTDAMLGDPARDFVFLVGWRGWPFTEGVLRHYQVPLDPGFRDRLSFMARLLTPIWLALAYERGTDVEKMTSWLHNAYATTHSR
jgi:aminoglycoside phosphotransferase (APT) family kinase protein